MVSSSVKALIPAYLARAFCCFSVGGFVLGCSPAVENLNNPAEVYNSYCFACHDSGAAHAPLLSDRDFWRSQATHKERLYQVTIDGKGAMPANGTCLDCSKEQLRQVVDWMLDQP